MNNKHKNLGSRLFLMVLISIFNYGCTAILDEIAASTVYEENKTPRKSAFINRQNPYPLSVSIITNTFPMFSLTPDMRESVYFEVGGCKSPIEKYHASFEFPIWSYSVRALKSVFVNVFTINANDYRKNKNKFDFVVRTMMETVHNHTIDAKKSAEIELNVRIEFRKQDGEKVFDQKLTGYGKSTEADSHGNYLDRFFNDLNAISTDPARYNYRSAVNKSMLDIFMKLKKILSDHPNFVDQYIDK